MTSPCWEGCGDYVCDSCSREECDCLNDGEEVAIMFGTNVPVRSGVDCLNGEPGVTAVEGRVVIDAGLLRELRREKMRRMTKGMKMLFFKFCRSDKNLKS